MNDVDKKEDVFKTENILFHLLLFSAVIGFPLASVLIFWYYA